MVTCTICAQLQPVAAAWKELGHGFVLNMVLPLLSVMLMLSSSFKFL